MATEEVKLPQLGESITEGIITAWLVDVGEEVEPDQPLFELSTDKVDTEVPSPVGGVLTEQRAAVDDTVEVGDVIAVIDTDADRSADSDSDTDTDSDATTAAAADDDQSADEAADDAEQPPDTDDASPASESADAQDTQQPQPAAEGRSPASSTGAVEVTGPDALVSPLVRRLLREAGLSADQVDGTGKGGRITRADAERAIARGPRASAEGARPPGRERPRPDPGVKQIDFEGREHTEDLSRVRKAIARHMHDSLQSTAQLTAVVEVDLTRVMDLRTRNKDAFKQRHGASLSPLPIIARATCMTIPRHPVVNSRIDVEEGTATYLDYINLGIAVDTERGLLVPNIKDAGDLSVAELATMIADFAGRARDKKLQPDEISGGTFTITNTGSRGAMLDTPILNPPEVAILAATLIEKRPVVVTDELGQDAISIRWMSYFCLTYDHRMVDGADAARFLSDLKWVLETHDFSAELDVA